MGMNLGPMQHACITLYKFINYSSTTLSNLLSHVEDYSERAHPEKENIQMGKKDVKWVISAYFGFFPAEWPSKGWCLYIAKGGPLDCRVY